MKQSNDNAETDSAYAESLGSSTTSLGESIIGYKYENGRRYHAYRDGEYPLPNDEKEQDRLDLLHHIFKLMLGGNLYIAPLPPNPQRILDFGTGTGIWALDMADENPTAEVIGTDLSPIQPLWVAPNSRFVIDDVEDEWVYSSSDAFDFIHGRGMAGSIKDWAKLYNQIYAHLKPGGYLEMQEYETWIRSDDGTLDNCPSIIEWQAKIDEASRAFGKRMNVAGEQKEKLIAAGFEGVTDVVHKVPKDALHFLMLADFHLATFGAVAKRPKTERNRAL
jgi:SAM-dependent methyltransferase